MSMALGNAITLVPYYDIVIDKERVSDSFKQLITQVEFEDSDTEASLVRVSVNDMDFKFSKHFSLTEKTPIQVTMGFNKKSRQMLIGEITHIEASFGEDGVQNLVIGGIDTSNAMSFKKKSRTWKNTTRSAVVSAIAKEYGYKTVIQDTKEKHEQISQDNVTDAQLIKGLADEEAFEFYVFPDEKKLYFGDTFKEMKIRDTLYYKDKDRTIRTFEPTLVERNKKAEEDGHSTSDKSSSTGKDSTAGGGSGSSGGGVKVDVVVNDGDKGGGSVGIVGSTGAQKKKK